MIWSQQLRKVMRLRRFAVMLMIGLGILMGILGDRILTPIARLCPAPPAYGADVSDEIREQIDLLFQLDLLYCGELSSAQAMLTEPVYWGSDGINSVLFFQPVSLEGMGVKNIGFGNDFLPPPPGDSPPLGFEPDLPGQTIYRNQAPEGAKYYYRVEGAPADYDYAVRVRLRGPAAERRGLTGRDVWDDIDRVLNRLRGDARPEGRRRVTAQASMPILPDRWKDIRQRWVNPELADESGDPTFSLIANAELPGPTLYQIVNGPLGSTIWIAGAVTDTNPALILVPEVGGQSAAEPFSTTLWVGGQETATVLAEFAFAPQPAGIAFEARYWHREGARGTSPPDNTWPVEFPSWQVARESRLR